MIPRVVPSDVVKAADQIFPDFVNSPGAFPGMGPDYLPRLLILAELVDRVPPELLTVDRDQYVALTASVAYLRGLPNAFHGGHKVITCNIPGYNHNPVAIIRETMTACPDQAPPPGTKELLFIAEPGLRDDIRLDIGAANSDLAQGEWKGATVLAASAVEALLLWALQEHEQKTPGSVDTAVAALVPKILGKNPGADLEGQGWHLHEYVEVAAHLKLIKDETAKLVRLAKDARNLVHPGRAARVGQKCDRATALVAIGAIEAVVRDLT